MTNLEIGLSFLAVSSWAIMIPLVYIIYVLSDALEDATDRLELFRSAERRRLSQGITANDESY